MSAMSAMRGVARPAVRARRAAVLGQLALIVVGVYLGLQADEWRDRRRQAELTRTTLRAFHDEITRNRATLASVLPYHREVGRSLTRVWRAHLASGAPLTLDALRTEARYEGTQFPELSATAYDLAVATQVVGTLPPDLVSLLSRTYERQRDLAGSMRQVNDAILNAPELARDEWTRAAYLLAMGISETRAAEDVLVAKYDSSLARLAAALRGRR